MSRSLPRFTLSIVLASSSVASAWQQPQPTTDDVGEVGVSSADAATRVRVKLERVMPPPGTRPFIPERPAQITLSDEPGVTITQLPPLRSTKPRYGSIRLGRGGRQVVVLDQSAPATSIYDLMWIDRNRDLAFSGAAELEPVQGVVVTDPEFDLEYVEFTALPLEVYYGVRVDAAGVESQDVETIAFTFYGRHPRNGVIGEISMVAASWSEGAIEIDGRKGRVVVFDESAKALYAAGESRWALLEFAPGAPLPEGLELTSSKIPLRFGERPYRLISVDPEGRRAEIGEETEANTLQSLLDTDPLQTEPPRPRAAEPVTWLADFDAAAASAKAAGKPLCVLYTAEWSRSARLLADRTLQDAEVARLLSEKFVCVKLNPALSRALAVRHGATLVPSLVMIDRAGNVVDRIVGYRQARMLADDLRRWRN